MSPAKELLNQQKSSQTNTAEAATEITRTAAATAQQQEQLEWQPKEKEEEQHQQQSVEQVIEELPQKDLYMEVKKMSPP